MDCASCPNTIFQIVCPLIFWSFPSALLLHGLQATTHHGAIEFLRDVAPEPEVVVQESGFDSGYRR
jgi:hypothetical protein